VKYRTILCEDNRYVRDLVNYILEERGHEILSFKDAGDCPLYSLTECECNHINLCSDIIISDISMPKSNGLEFVEELLVIGQKKIFQGQKKLAVLYFINLYGQKS